MASAIDILNTRRLRRGRRAAPAAAASAPTLVDAVPAASEARPAPSRQSRSRAAVAGWLTWPLRAVRGLLLLDVQMRRHGRSLHIVIGSKPPAPRRPSASDRAVAQAAPQRRALKRLLNRHSLSRRMLRHLAYVECGLATEGLAALDVMPHEVLSVALAQLDAIVSNWSDRDLADLRSRMAVALKERIRALSDDFAGPVGEQRSDFLPGSRLMVDEASHSLFLELERQYEAVLPRESIHAALGYGEAAPDAPPEVTCALANAA